MLLVRWPKKYSQIGTGKETQEQASGSEDKGKNQKLERTDDGNPTGIRFQSDSTRSQETWKRRAVYTGHYINTMEPARIVDLLPGKIIHDGAPAIHSGMLILIKPSNATDEAYLRLFITTPTATPTTIAMMRTDIVSIRPTHGASGDTY